MKLVVFPRNIDLAKAKDFWAALYPFLFQFAFREFFFAFDVRFLGTAIAFFLILLFYVVIDLIILKVAPRPSSHAVHLAYRVLLLKTDILSY